MTTLDDRPRVELDHPPTRAGDHVRITAVGLGGDPINRLEVGQTWAVECSDPSGTIAFIAGKGALVAALGDRWEIVPTNPKEPQP